jgi:hypothetical protein
VSASSSSENGLVASSLLKRLEYVVKCGIYQPDAFGRYYGP